MHFIWLVGDGNTMSILFDIKDLNLPALQRVFGHLTREFDKLRTQGNDKWWQPEKLRRATSAPQGPQDGATYWSAEDKCDYVYHAGEGKWYKSNPYTLVGEIDGGGA